MEKYNKKAFLNEANKLSKGDLISLLKRFSKIGGSEFEFKFGYLCKSRLQNEILKYLED